jgi:hypothetical protein
MTKLHPIRAISNLLFRKNLIIKGVGTFVRLIISFYNY